MCKMRDIMVIEQVLNLQETLIPEGNDEYTSCYYLLDELKSTKEVVEWLYTEGGVKTVKLAMRARGYNVTIESGLDPEDIFKQSLDAVHNNGEYKGGKWG